jgi:flavin reductase (DIM6/NTAB) family NADH-FMN oxidoreductase RutF
MVTHNPPVISVSVVNMGPGKPKDTARNIIATKGFTVNIISEPFVENANVCSVEAPEGLSEWPLSGLTKEPSIHVKPARVKESAFSMECEVRDDVPGRRSNQV